jgi:hypothetical protein
VCANLPNRNPGPLFPKTFVIIRVDSCRSPIPGLVTTTTPTTNSIKSFNQAQGASTKASSAMRQYRPYFICNANAISSQREL